MSAIADMMSAMNYDPKKLLADAEAFITREGMGDAYFGKAACGNSELIQRLRGGGRVWPETEAKVRAFMANRTPSSASREAGQ